MTISSPTPGQWLTTPAPGIPRTSDGSPNLSAPAPRTAWDTADFSGVWAAARVSGDLPDSGSLHPWVRTLMNQRRQNFFADSPRYNCLPSGPAYLTSGSTSGGVRRIVQSPTIIAILHEDLTHRQIFMDGRELESDPFPTWMGYSIGYWDGDTLVVESNGYNDKTWLDRRGASHTEQLQITERYHRVDFGHIELEVTYDDPGAFDSPLMVTIELVNQADTEMLEVVCNEFPQTGSGWTGDVTQIQSTVIELDPAILTRYVGTYEGLWLGRTIRLEFSLEDNELKLRRNGIDVQLFAQSQTAFDASNGFGFVFTVDDQGIATAVDEIHVSGGWSFPRVQ
jgi:hypothetical protein